MICNNLAGEFFIFRFLATTFQRGFLGQCTILRGLEDKYNYEIIISELNWWGVYSLLYVHMRLNMDDFGGEERRRRIVAANLSGCETCAKCINRVGNISSCIVWKRCSMPNV
jgi:hypothetical protein